MSAGKYFFINWEIPADTLKCFHYWSNFSGWPLKILISYFFVNFRQLKAISSISKPEVINHPAANDLFSEKARQLGFCAFISGVPAVSHSTILPPHTAKQKLPVRSGGKKKEGR